MARYLKQLRDLTHSKARADEVSLPYSESSSSAQSASNVPQGLHVLAEGTNPIVDIVAVHGLNGHSTHTWTAQNGVNWLRDLLPTDLPRARILSWGYDARTHSRLRVSCQYLYDHARSLVSDLCLDRRLAEARTRPIIFVAHSLGGIVVKSALIHADAARQGALAEHRSIKLSTYGVIFMGTPHQGAGGGDGVGGVGLGRLMVNVASVFVAGSDRLLKHLERDSEWLQQQLGQYGAISGDFVTKFAFEEYLTPTVLGRAIMVVPRASAVVPGAADVEPIAIHANHVDMVRFESQQDTGYRTVSGHLRIMAEDASDAVSVCWDIENRVNAARINNPKEVVLLDLDRKMSCLLSSLQSLPFQDKHRDVKMRRMDGLGQWLLNMPAFKAWCDGSAEKNMLWCYGAPGVGKTFLTSVIVDQLEDRSLHTDCRVLYFYFDYKQQSEQTPFRVLETLLRQLLSTYSTLPNAAKDLYKRIDKGQGLPSWADLMKTFRSICSSSNEVFLVLDAMDECDENTNREKILELVEFLVGSNARVVVTSRPYPWDINRTFADYPQIAIEAADSDVRAFLLAKIIKSKRGIRPFINETLREEIVESIAAKSQGMFLLPALQISIILGQTNARQVREALRTLPSGLVDNLDLTMERIKSQDAEGHPKAELALKTLMWLSTVKRPLTIMELQHAIATTPDALHLDELTDTTFFTETCLGLATFDSKTSIIRLVHLSVNEYFQERRETIFPQADGKLAVLCLSYLSLDGFRASIPSNKGAFDNLVAKWPLLKYSITFWGIHAAASFNVEVKKKTSAFLSCDTVLEFWCQGFEYERSGEGFMSDSDSITKYIIRNLSALHIAAIFGIKKLADEALQKTSSNASPKDSAGRTPLMLAAAHGKEDILELLLSRSDVDVNCTDLEGATALGYAVDQLQINIVQTLLSSAASLDVNAGSPFLSACKHLDIDHEESRSILALLLSRPDLEVNPEPGGSYSQPWYLIASNADIEILQALLARKDFDPYCWGSSDGLQDFFNYVRNTDYFGSIRLLAEFPIIVKLLDDDAHFRLEKFAVLEVLWPFAYFAFNPDISWEVLDSGEHHYKVDWLGVWDDSGGTWRAQVRKSLKNHGFSLQMTDSEQRSFLHFVAREGADEYVEFLIRNGVDVAATDKLGRTPLYYAVRRSHENTVRILLDAGASPEAADQGGWTILHEAASHGNLSIWNALIDHGVDLTAKNKLGEYVLHATVMSEEAECIITILLNYGFMIDILDKHSNTPLAKAVKDGSLEACQVLLDKGADPNICSLAGPPLYYAAQCMSEGFLKALLSDPRTDPNLLGCCGRSGLDLIADYKPMAEKMAFALTKHKPTSPSARRAHLLQALQWRVDIMVAGGEDNWQFLAFRLGKQLSLLGDEAGARIAYEINFSEESKGEEPFVPDLCCDQCFTDRGLQWYCKTCPTVMLCPKCIADRNSYSVPWCQGHDFIQVPGDGWKDLPKGVVNREGQSLGEWLRTLQKRYCGESAVDTPELPSNPVTNLKRQRISRRPHQHRVAASISPE